MAKNWEQQIGKWAQKWVSTEETLTSARRKVWQKLKHFLSASTYWGGVVLIGLVASGGVMHLGGVPLLPQPAEAGVLNAIGTVFAYLLYFMGMVIPGTILAIEGFILELVIGYPWSSFWQLLEVDGFVNVPAVITGWKTVRNVSNVFFSLILVIIALATVLKIEAYSWKQTLPKFIIYAILINFSKSIAGVFTDLATVAMATFGGSFGSTFASGLIQGFGIVNVSNIDTGFLESTSSGANSFLGAIAAFAAAGFMVWTALIIFLVLIIILLVRIVALWVLIVMSPIAYITRILPITMRYSQEWWQRFGAWCIMGPLVTFFLWLSLSIAFGVGGTVGSGTGATKLHEGLTSSQDELDTALKLSGSPNQPSSKGFKALQAPTIANFLIMTVLLSFCLMQVKKLSGEAASIIGKTEEFGKGLRKGAFNMTRRAMTSAGGAARKRGQRVGGKSGYALNALAGTMEFGAQTIMNPSFLPKLAESFGKASDKKTRATNEALASRAESLATTSDTDDKGSYSIANMLKRAIGHTMAAGSDSGEQVFDRVLSARGGYNMMRKMAAIGQGKYRDLHEANKTEDQKLKEYQDASRAHNRIINDEEAAMNVEDDFNAVRRLANGEQAPLEMSDMATRLTIQAQLNDLNARHGASTDSVEKAQLQRQINALNDVQMGVGDWKELKESGAADLIASGAETYLKEERQRRLEAKGATFDSEGNMVSGPAGEDTDHAARFTEYSEAAQVAAALGHELAALGSGRNADTRNARNAAVAESMKELEQYPDTDDLRQFLYRSRDQKDFAGVEAVMKRIYQKGDENELFGKWLVQMMKNDSSIPAEAWGPDDAAGNPMLDESWAKANGYTHDADPDHVLQPGSDADGGELFRKYFMQGQMGWAEQDALRVMSDMSFVADKGNHYGLSAGYKYRADRIVPVDPASRSLIAGSEISKMKFGDALARGNRLQLVREGGDGKFQSVSAEGVTLLNNFEQEISTPHYFKQMSANTREYMSRPEVVADMVQKKVKASVIAAFMNYGRSTQGRNYSSMMNSLAASQRSVLEREMRKYKNPAAKGKGSSPS